MHDLIVRRPEDKDIANIAEFNQKMAVETEGKRLDAQRLEQGVAALIHNPDRGFYLLACLDEKVVGQLMVTYEWSDWRNGVFWWIQSVYVHPDHRRRHVYRKLYERVHSEALADPDVCGLRLYVMESNTAAKAAYQSLGMEATQYQIYEEEFDRT